MLQEVMPFLSALVIGFLIGIERERSNGQSEKKAIFGARTFPLVALLGVLTAYLENQSLIIIFGIFICILVLSNHLKLGKDKESDPPKIGATTAVTVILTFALGYLANSNAHVAIILTVLVFGILAIRKYLHNFARSGINEKEMNAALTFLVSAFVILPLLPDDYIDPWQLIHPTRIWLLFVVIAGIEFLSYVILRQARPKQGLLITGLFGGLVSSTATTLSLAKRARENPKMTGVISGGIILADASSLCMQLIVLAVVAPKVAANLSLFLVVPLVVGVLCVTLLHLMFRHKNDESSVLIDLGNPISIKNTASFALMISAGLILVVLAQRWFGDAGVYLTSALGGAASLRAVTFSVSELANAGTIAVSVAALAIILAMATNMIVKLVLIQRAGGTKIFVSCALFFAVILTSSLAVFVFWMF